MEELEMAEQNRLKQDQSAASNENGDDNSITKNKDLFMHNHNKENHKQINKNENWSELSNDKWEWQSLGARSRQWI